MKKINISDFFKLIDEEAECVVYLNDNKILYGKKWYVAYEYFHTPKSIKYADSVTIDTEHIEKELCFKINIRG